MRQMYANQDEATLAHWRDVRENAFNESDLNRDGVLDKWESDRFFDRVREGDGKEVQTDTWIEKASR